MTTYFSFYNTTSNPTGFVGTVGGAINTGSPVVGQLNEIFTHVDAPPSGVGSPFYQYRKIHVKNISSKTFENVRLWIGSAEHSDQISVGFENGIDTSVSSPTSEPSTVTWTSATSYADGQRAEENFTAGTATGIWIRQKLQNINEPDPYSSFMIFVGGLEI